MERSVIFRDRQELQSSDLNNIESFTRSAIDHVVYDAVNPNKAYAGFTVTKTSTTQFTVTPGRLYSAGAVFARDENVVLDSFNSLPLVTQKRVAIVVWGQTIQTDNQPRDFLVDAQTGQTEPQTVAMQDYRYCQVNLVSGVEAADPQYPTTDANVVVVAYALLSPNGIVSIEQVGKNRLSNLANVDTRTTSLETWRGQIGARVDSLATDLAAIQKSIKSYTLLTDFYKLSDRVARAENELAKPKPVINEFAGYWEDHFLDASGSDPSFTGYTANVEEGIRTGFAAKTTAAALTLLNPTDPGVQNNSGFILPKYTHAARLVTTGYNGELSLSQAAFGEQVFKQLTRSVTTLRYGSMLTQCSNWGMWSNVRYNAATGLFTIPGYSGNQEYRFVNETDYQHWLSRTGSIRFQQVFEDTTSETYWGLSPETVTVQGSILAQTVLWSQTAWLSQLGLYFTRVGASGDVTVLVAETINGVPNMNRVLGRTTLSRADIKTATGTGGTGLPAATVTNVPIQPILLTGGNRYAIIIVSSGSHYIATSTTDNNVLNGTLFRSTDTGGYFLGDLGVDLKLDLYTAKFTTNRVSVEFNSPQLSGGASRVDIAAQTTRPPATQLNYEIYLNGTWQTLATDGTGPTLASLPAVVRLRATFIGTVDLMPGVSLTASAVTLYRDALTFTWVSDIKEPMTSAEQIRVAADMESWNGSINSVNCYILTGTNFTTVETADVTETATIQNGVVRKTWTFSGISPGVNQYRVKLTGSTTTLADPFHVANMKVAEYTAA